ncbi:polyadenylate-binding protein 3-like, partial [Asparagus officinalis]|uniref:polyadenylate-binding protein 3-like n=1 Tax=Asparagus officinalis TaxID=4686 RepID=UPI00098E11FB
PASASAAERKEEGGTDPNPKNSVLASGKVIASADERDSNDGDNADGDHITTPKAVEIMRRRLKEIEEAAVAIRKILPKLEKEMADVVPVGNPSSDSDTQTTQEEVDSRSIFVGNVDYYCTLEEIQQHFHSCGTVNRITILIDEFGQPKGFAYVEFLELDAVQNALLLNESELHGRKLKVSAKRTNFPGMKQYGEQWPPYMAFRSERAYMPSFGFGKAPRFRRPRRFFRPY